MIRVKIEKQTDKFLPEGQEDTKAKPVVVKSYGMAEGCRRMPQLPNADSQ